LAFIRSHVKRFDDFHQEQADCAVDVETTSDNYVSHAEGLRPRFHTTILGAKQSISTIKQVIENCKKDPAFTAFRSRISTAVKKKSQPEDTVAISDLHPVRLIIYPIDIMFYNSLYPDHRVSADQGEIRIGG
jgi:hypothetical protein